MREDITNFSIKIEEMVAKNIDMTYMEAILDYCEKNQIEPEVAAKLISFSLKAKLQIEAENLNFLPKSNTAKLPI
jgi:hypothetical protein